MKEEILGKVDHTLLKQEAKWEDIKQLCDDAITYKTASVSEKGISGTQFSEWLLQEMRLRQDRLRTPAMYRSLLR